MYRDEATRPIRTDSFERGIKINNISAVRYGRYYRGRWRSVAPVCTRSYDGLISRDRPILNWTPVQIQSVRYVRMLGTRQAGHAFYA